MFYDEYAISAASAIANLADRTLPLLALAAAVGVVATAIIQLIKEALYVRSFYNEARFYRWAKSKWGDKDLEVAKAVVSMVGGGSRFSMFGQSAQELAQSLRTAMHTALADLESHAAIAEMLSTPDAVKAVKKSSEIDSANSAEADRAITIAGTKINAFQLSVSHWWKFWLRIAASAISALILLYGYTVVGGEANAIGTGIAVVLGGLIAPMAKDVVSAVEGLRKP